MRWGPARRAEQAGGSDERNRGSLEATRFDELWKGQAARDWARQKGWTSSKAKQGSEHVSKCQVLQL